MNSIRPFLLDQLESYFRKLTEEIDFQNHRLISLSIRIDDFPEGRGLFDLPDLHFWSCPEKNISILGAGKAFAFESQGNNRFQDLIDIQNKISRKWLHVDPDGMRVEPVLFTGFAFSSKQEENNLPNASLHVPEFTVQQKSEAISLTLNWDLKVSQDLYVVWKRWETAVHTYLNARNSYETEDLQPNTLILSRTDDDRTWLDKVRQAIRDIDGGMMRKVVLSRTVEVTGARTFQHADVIDLLSRRFPTCATIARKTMDGMIVAATPEKMISLNQGYASCDALAGTQPRAVQDNMNFLSDDKIREEHQLVVEAIKDHLSPLSEDVTCVSEPQVLDYRNLQHLCTPIEAKVKKGTRLLDLAARIHPTPAVGGFPQAEAMEWLDRYKSKRSHWYTGAFGWMTPDGDGELSVVLRCAHLSGAKAELSAGAGIVAGSTPKAELEETNIKLDAMLGVLEDA